MARTRGSRRLTLPIVLLAFWALGQNTGLVRAQAAAGTPSPHAAAPRAPLFSPASDAEMERFLKQAKVVKTKTASKGVTNSTQATLSDGRTTHDAHIQIIDEYKREFRSQQGVEFDFRDSWTFNVAAYKLDRLIGLNMIPVSVAGSYRSNRAAFTWWVDDVMMDEGGRLKKKVEPPEDKVRYWNQQIYMMRLFDQLIYNIDRNLGNMLISNDWRLWPIDHTRAFRKQTTLKTPAQITRCDRAVFERLKTLDRDLLKKELGAYLDDGQIKSLLTRRDLIVAKLESIGPSAFFERQSSPTTTH
jgi:hypothetical protein